MSVRSDAVFREDVFYRKTVLTTGGGSGICKGMTLAMMRHGCNAIIVGRNKEKITSAAAELSRQTKRKCIGVSADVRDVKSLEKAVEEGVEEFGGIDYVICGAAGNFLALGENISPNAFKSVIDIDLLGTFNTIKATLPHVKTAAGAYIAVSATLHYSGLIMQSHASAAKAGVDALCRSLAVELGPSGVRYMTLAPGPIAGTEGIDRLLPTELKEQAVRSIPLQRLGTIDDIANATVFLFSPAASFVTGTTLVVDGGQWHTQQQFGYPESVSADSQPRPRL
ncbi:uncharacterized protein L969DRAFT_92721 [Mixia osmundae IAM 14324]|uniref:2,4-dienoyl-CoA reductase [(3E)-enoyl-CoA-producing] n=1 Tax=Mixia osmundae (strain CBS 9802 / IAM 14324 / JCM 22182 / KY 12970) TaxID=764103 RepID=G7DYC9_MIXOS|nr:uncharacterized protein L969DRAFT_92721 [Mixia osmundae IAM 14324]KEI41492.1 hypothetical protein L969DRAFT_92721 [Mixia osmundae IAM 14324]GAA95589.1 hypothetical protein E5Q_02245 [Mixia osmundae IAM 14324]